MRGARGERPRQSPRGAPLSLGVFLVVMLVFGIITSLHGMSPLATYGLGAIFYLAAAIILFLIPAALVAAELGTTFQRDGGVYVWVSEAFGPRAGFVATWLQWFQNVIFWTVILTSSAAMIALSLGWEAGTDDRLYTAGDLERPFAIPGGRWGIGITCATGIAFSVAAFAVGFIPPAGLPEASVATHTIVLGGAIAFGMLAPLGISRWSRRQEAI